jgi:hypothetical protein
MGLDITGMGALAQAASGIFQTATTTLNPKVRENQLAIAEANARTAEATAKGQSGTSFDPKYIIIAIIVLVLIVAVFMKVKPNTQA